MSGWVKFYASDWLAGTSGLTAAERGVYITLVCLIYELEGPIPLDEGRLARRCGVTKPAFRKSLEALQDEGKITVKNGEISNSRAEKELSDRTIRSQKASASASQRWIGQSEKRQQKQRQPNANASAKQCETHANQIPEPDIPVPIGTGQIDFEKAIFENGVLYLMDHGRAETQARALVGKWRKDATSEEVFKAFSEAKKAGVTEPVAYITALLKPQPSVGTDMQQLLKEGRI